MNKQDRLKKQIIEAVNDFQGSQLAVTCESIAVDIHPDTLVVTLRGAMCPAERDYARDREARELLERSYGELFDVTKPLLEAEMQKILGRKIQASKLSIDPESGAGVILLMLARDTCPGIETPNTER